MSEDINFREQERRRLARQVQARLGASLNLLLAQTRAYRAALTVTPSKTGPALDTLAAMTTRALQDLQDLVADLAPTDLQDLSLAAALESLALRVERRYGLTITLDLPVQNAPPHLALPAYRICQELLDNAGQHAGAGRVGINIRLDQAALTITIADDGHGFHPPEQFTDLLHQDRCGLALCDELCRAIGGWIEIHAVIGVGTQVRAVLPLAPASLSTQAEPSNPQGLVESLTAREQEVLAGVVEGLTNKQIAARLGISDRTVQFHLSNVLGKLGVASRTEVAVLALQKGRG
ncbi:MAG: hypothetical protein JW934_15390 [Anaerolineae bacterium]|nr:hypothetical protein [Anaerolineae bacterium]